MTTPADTPAGDAPGPDTLRPDGLWARTLRHLDTTPRAPAELLPLVTGPGSRWRRFRKLNAALHGLARNDWADGTHFGWIITPAGVAAREALGLTPATFTRVFDPAGDPTP